MKYRPKMDIKRWVPRSWLKWHLNAADGSIDALLQCEYGSVHIFTFPGDLKHRAFTNIQMFIYPHKYDTTLPRHYAARWLPRLARNFAWECQQLADGRKS